MKNIFFLLVFIFISQAAYAADTICGVDTDMNGTYSNWCNTPDEDRDGYTTDGSGVGYDCDDHNRFIYPGVAVGCDSGGGANSGWQMCQADGSYTTCTANTSTAYCPSGCAACYYIDVVGGNDANPGTFASPWKSVLKFVTYYAPGDAPSGWVDVVDGSGNGRCFLLKSGIYEDHYRYGPYETIDRGIFIRGRHANSAHPFRVMSYPGALVTIKQPSDSTTKMDPITIFQSSYGEIWGLVVNGNYCNSDTGSGCLSGIESDHVIFANNIVYGNAGVALSTFGGIQMHTLTNSAAHHNVAYNNFDAGTPSSLNNCNFLVWRGSNNALQDNVSFYSIGGTYNKTLFQKHADYTSSLAVVENVFFNGNIHLAGPNVNFTKNLLRDNPLGFGDFGGPAYQHDIAVTHNTFKNSPVFYNPQKGYNVAGGAAADMCSGDAAIGTFVFQDNIIADNITYTSDTRPFTAWVYGPDSLYTDVVTGTKLTFDHNCYYNNVVPVSFGLFESNNGDTTCGGRGNLGSMYTFDTWKSVAGLDTDHSYEFNPFLDSSDMAAVGAGVCDTFGWRTAADLGGGEPSPPPLGGPNSIYHNKVLTWRPL